MQQPTENERRVGTLFPSTSRTPGISINTGPPLSAINTTQNIKSKSSAVDATHLPEVTPKKEKIAVPTPPEV